jgi:glutamine amidotransferase
VDFRDLVRELRTDCAVVHVRHATVGNRALENTHPFRFRHWLFAHNGSLPGFASLRPALLERIPEFLVRSIRGETDSELIFSLFLGRVHETGRLDDPELDRRSIADALKQTVEILDEVADAGGQPRGVLNAVVTNHHAMVALRRGLPMAWIRRHGIRDCEACRKQPDVTGREPRRVDHEQFKYVMVASDQAVVPPDWFELPEGKRGAILAVDRSLDAQVVEL